MSDPVSGVVQVNITAASATPTLPGTNIPAFITYHTHFTDLIRTYTDPSQMLTDGATVNEPAYLLASAICAQNPRPQKFKWIRGTNSVAQVIHFKVAASPPTGNSIGLSLRNASGVVVPIYHTAASETAAQVATALAAIVVSGASLVVDGVDNTQVNITISSSGAIWYPSAMKGGTYTDVTPTAAPGPDLDAASLVDPDWYGISGAWMDATNIGLIATWAQTNKRFHSYTTCDSANENTPPAGPMGTAKSAAQGYSFGQFCGLTPSTGSTPAQYGATAAMSMLLVQPPGSFALAYKTEASVSVDSLTPTQTQNITGNNGNYYIAAAGINSLFDGRMADAGWADIRIGLDALSREIQLEVFGFIANSPKPGYDRAGISGVKAQVLSAIKSFIPTKFISNDAGFEPRVSVPDITTISAADKTARILRSVNFTCTAVGAIGTVLVNGTVSF